MSPPSDTIRLNLTLFDIIHSFHPCACIACVLTDRGVSLQWVREEKQGRDGLGCEGRTDVHKELQTVQVGWSG